MVMCTIYFLTCGIRDVEFLELVDLFIFLNFSGSVAISSLLDSPYYLFEKYQTSVLLQTSAYFTWLCRLYILLTLGQKQMN